MEIGALVAVVVFCAGVIFAGGRLSARVEHLEGWRKEVLDDLKEIRLTLTRIEQALEQRS